MTKSRHTLLKFRPAILGMTLAVSVFALAACRQNGAEGVAAPPTPPAVDVSMAKTPADAVPTETPPAFLSALKQGMPYAKLREAVTTAGWVPLRDPGCWDKVGGEARVCDALLETESCSGDGACSMWFADPADGRRLRVSAYGPYERWNVPGEEATFAVRSWDLRPAATVAVASACPAEDFDAFLKRFAADPAIRNAFTAPVMEVGELYTNDKGNDAARTVYVAADAYRDFDMVYRDGAYHYEDPTGAVDATVLPVKVESPSNDVRIVRFVYGMSEGNAYRFETRRGCWVLTADPEPPSP